MADLVVPAAIRALRAIVRKGISAVEKRLPQGAIELEPALVRNPQRLNPISRIRQNAANAAQNKRAFQSHINDSFSRYYTTATRASRPSGSAVKSAVGKSNRISPFASTLRPKLCGALPRSAGGYGLGGSARYFSHSPTAPAEVIQQVSQAMRAFLLSGKDIRYNQTRGNTYTKGQIRAQLAAASTDRLAPGAYVDFKITPVNCMSINEPVGVNTLDLSRGGFLDALSADFQETIRDISAVFQDLRRLASLGDLPISLVNTNTLRVHFHGCDKEIVTRLCDEVGVCRGLIHEDERFAFDKLMSGNDRRDVNWQEMMSSSGESDWSGSQYSNAEVERIMEEVGCEPAWESEMENDYDEIEPGGESRSSSEGYGSQKIHNSRPMTVRDDIEGFLAECEGYRNPWVAGRA